MKLDLKNKWLTDIPDDIFQLDITRLDLHGNRLNSLPPEIVRLTNLKELFLDRNQFKLFPPEIGQLTNLTHLDLSNNFLTSLPPEIGRLKNLTHLLLHGNKISKLPHKICRLNKLTTLDLRGNQFGSFEILKKPTLFDFLGNQLSGFPDITNLKELLLGRNKLSNLQPEIAQLKNLTHLDLNNNRLTGLPNEIGQLKNLTHLDLRGNQLSRFPEIAQLTNLKKLDLGKNKLINLPSDIGLLKNLTHLDLSNNPLMNLPREIGRLNQLTHLDVRGEFLILPPEIVLLTKLEEILLDDYPYPEIQITGDFERKIIASLEICPKKVFFLAWKKFENSTFCVALMKGVPSNNDMKTESNEKWELIKLNAEDHSWQSSKIHLPGDLDEINQMTTRENIDCKTILKFSKKFWEKYELEIPHAEILFDAKVYVIKNDHGRLVYNRIIKHKENEESLQTIDHQTPFPFYVLKVKYTFACDHVGSHSFFFDNIESLFKEVDKTEDAFDKFKTEIFRYNFKRILGASPKSDWR